MSRVSIETIEDVQSLIDSLPPEARSKCALCPETLIHFVKQIEAQTGAGTATVTRELANRINKSAAPGDRVSGNQLRNRVQYGEGKVKSGNSANKIDHHSEKWPVCRICEKEKVSFRIKKQRGTGQYYEEPQKDGLCGDCRIKKFNDEREEFEARPVNQEAEKFWCSIAQLLAEKFTSEDAAIPVGKISRDTWELLSKVRKSMDTAIQGVDDETQFSC